MKRTPLKRKTPMKRVSAKRRALMKEVKGWRAEFIVSVKRCQICDRDIEWQVASPEQMDAGVLFTRSLTVHEIAKGPHRAEALKHRCCCLVVCNKCNCGVLCDYSIWPIERQLCVKLLTDPEHFDLVKFNQVRGRAPEAITFMDLVPYLTLRESV